MEEIKRIVDEAVRGGPGKPRLVRFIGTIKQPGALQYQMRHLSFVWEEEVPPDGKRREVVEEICAELGPLILEVEPKNGKNPAVSTDATPELDPAYLDGLGWTARPSGGEWIFRDTPGAKALSEELAKTSALTIGGYRYLVTKGRDREFINRHPVEATKK